MTEVKNDDKPVFRGSFVGHVVIHRGSGTDRTIQFATKNKTSGDEHWMRKTIRQGTTVKWMWTGNDWKRMN